MTSSHRLSYITGLDGIRAAAVLAVLFYHADYPWALGGFLGVETFFVLSGFLITALLMVEWRATAGIDLGHFWLRRARRLLPAVWALLLVLPVVAFLAAPDALPRLKEDIPAAFFYITNWVYIVREVPYFEAFGRPPLLQHLWSLAVEEQFYLLWPVILLSLLQLSRSRRHLLPAALAVLTALSALWMASLHSPDQDPLRVYYGTDTRASGFLVGALLAVLWPPRANLQPSARRWLDALGWGALLGLLLLYNQLNEFQPFLYRGGILATALASALLIAGASTPGTRIGRLLENSILRWIGSRSYSIYLWHWPVFMLSRPGFDLELPVAWIRLAQVLITFALAEISYRWIETPIRQRGFRGGLRSAQQTFRSLSSAQRVGLGAGVVTVSMLLLWQGALPRVQAREPAAGAAPMLQEPQLPAPTGTSAAPGPAATAVSTARATATALPGLQGPRVTLIGDSIMQGAAPLFDDMLGEGIHVDAERKRKMEDVPALVESLSQRGRLSSVVVIHLGSNRPFEAPVFDQVMESLLAHGVERAIFINVHRPIGWESYINRKFAEGAARWPQAELIDWDALAHSRQGWFIEDQTHLSYAGSVAYVEAIAEKLDTIP